MYQKKNLLDLLLTINVVDIALVVLLDHNALQNFENELVHHKILIGYKVLSNEKTKD